MSGSSDLVQKQIENPVPLAILQTAKHMQPKKKQTLLCLFSLIQKIQQIFEDLKSRQLS